MPAEGEGQWPIRAERDADYTIELRWPKLIGTLELTAGSVGRTIEVRAPTDRVTIDRLALPRGELDLAVMHRPGNKRDGTYHVILTRL
jgi:hypothetical protein